MGTKFRIILFLLVISTGLMSQENKKKTMALTNLEGIGLSADVTLSMANRLRSELVKAGEYTILERGDMDAILKEQGLQLSGCTTDECIVEIGQLLSVQYICSGSIGKVGSIYTMSVRIIDVSSGEILQTVIEDCQCSIEEVLTTSLRNVAFRISGIETAIYDENGGEFKKGFGNLYLKTDPSGASVWIDNVNTGQTTPVTLKNISSGKHIIRVSTDIFESERIVTILPDEFIEETIYLDVATGGLKIYCDPIETNVFLDDRSQGKTPLVLQNIRAGQHTIRLEKSGFATRSKLIIIEPEQFEMINEVLEKNPSINVTSNPNDAEIFINDKYFGNTPANINHLAPEVYELSIRRYGYIPQTDSLRIESAKKYEFKGNLTKMASMVVNSEPRFATVYINEEKAGRTPVDVLLLPERPQKIEIKKSGYDNWTKTFTLKAGSKETLNPKLILHSGRLVLQGLPENSSMVLNGKKGPIKKSTMLFPVGSYKIKCNSPGYTSEEFKFKISKGEDTEIQVQMHKKLLREAFLKSLMWPGSGQLYQEKKELAVLYKISFFFSGVGALVYTRETNNAQADYDDTVEKFENAGIGEVNSLEAAMESAKDKFTENEMIRDTFYNAVAAVYVINLIDVLIIPPKWKRKAYLSAKATSTGFQAGICIAFR